MYKTAKENQAMRKMWKNTAEVVNTFWARIILDKILTEAHQEGMNVCKAFVHSDTHAHTYTHAHPHPHASLFYNQIYISVSSAFYIC